MNIKYYDLHIKDAVATALAPFSKDYKVVDAFAVSGVIVIKATKNAPGFGHLPEVLVYVRQPDGKLLFSLSDEAL